MSKKKGKPVKAKNKPRQPAKFVGLRIDVETKSATDVAAGSYKYAEDHEFDMLVVCYAPIRQYEGGARSLGTPRKLDLFDQQAVDKFAAVLLDERFEKHAFNANFERVVLSRWLGMGNGEYIDPKNWRCSAIQANVAGVFGRLDDVGRAVRSPASKSQQGKALIKMFSVPMTAALQKRADSTCGCQMFHSPTVHPDEFTKFEEYCAQDVVTEATVSRLLPDMPEAQQAEYEMDQRINDRGFRHDRKLSEAAVAAVLIEKTRTMADLKTLTGLDNPNSNQQMSDWLDRQGYPMVSLDKAHREDALADPLCPPLVAEVLTLKGRASLTSVSKHQAALKARGADGRIRGSLQYYGAHTGREAGRGIQPQNLPTAEASVKDRKRLLKGKAGRDAPEIAKGTVRASIRPAKGHLFVGVDYNAIEARTLGWASGERYVNDEFDPAKGGQGKIYEVTAEMMFGVPKAQIIAARIKCDDCGHCFECLTRKKGKVSNLALGYNGGAGALVTMGAEAAGIDCGNYVPLKAEWTALGSPGKFWEWEKDRHDYPELLKLRDLYREASPMTVRFWKLCNAAWDKAALTGETQRFGENQILAMMRDGKHNRLILPSGRSIWYRFAAAHVDPDRDRVDRRTFIGKGKGVGHVRTDTHGGKLTENLNQAIARDVLFWVMAEIEKAKIPGRLVLHVHDEVLLETREKHAEQVLADVKGLMSLSPPWAKGLNLKGVGEVMDRYKK